MKTSFATGGAHTYQAYVAADTSLNDLQASSNEVVVERAAWTVALSADKLAFAVGEKVTLTATPNQDVKASSYRLVVKDVTTGGVLGYCGSSSSVAVWSVVDGTCTVTTSFATGGAHTYQAYVATDNTGNNLQATSNEVVLERAAWTVTLAADKVTFVVGEKVTLTATANQDVKASSYRLVVRDVTTGGVLGYCGSNSSVAVWSVVDRTCTVTTSFATGGPHTYQAYVAGDNAGTDLQATSNEVVLQRMAWAAALVSDSAEFAAGQKSTLTVTVNQDVKASSYQVVVKDVTTGGTVGYCHAGTDSNATWSAGAKTCTVQVSFPTGGPHTYRAYVAAGTSLADVQALSNDVVVQRMAWTVSLSADRTVFDAGEKVALTATVNQDIMKSGYMVLFRDDAGTNRGHCRAASDSAPWSPTDLTCTVQVSFATGGPYTYQAYVVADWTLADTQAASNGVTLQRAPWTVTLMSSASLTSAGDTITLTAAVNQNIKQADYMLVVREVTADSLVGYCQVGNDYGGVWSADDKTCTVTVNVASGAVRVYVAYVAMNFGRDDIQAISNGFSAPNTGGPGLPGETAGGSNPSQACAQTCHGDPVNTATGEFFEHMVDLEVPGLGPGLVWARTYGSQVASDDTGLGFGWSSPYTMRLVGSGGAGLASPWVDVVQENGSRVRFAADGLGGFAAPLRVLATLERAGDGSYRFVRGARQVFVFDTAGVLVRVEDLNGNGVGLSYDPGGHLVQVSDDVGRSLVVTWSGDRVAQVADLAGRTVSYSYSPSGDLVDVTQADGTHLGYGYTAHKVTSMTSATGGVTTNVYDSSGRVTSQSDPLGRTTTFAYVLGGVLVTDPAGNVTREQYVDGRLVLQTVGYGTAAAATTVLVYGPTNQPVLVTDPLRQVTTHTYDAAGNRTSTTDPLGRVTTWTYDGLGSMTSATDPTGATWTFTFDQRGNPTGATSPTGAQTTAVVNPDGTVASVSDPLGLVTSYTYDARGYRTSTTDPAGAVVTAAWDLAGQMTSTTDAVGKTTAVGYDQAGRVTSVTDPTGAVTTVGYDAAGRPTTVTDPLGRTSTAVYDAAGQLVSATDPANAVTSTGYDLAGRVVQVTDPTGAVTGYAYDAAGRPTAVTDPLGQVTTTTYDAASQVTAVTYPSGATWGYTYDAAGQATVVSDPLGAVWTTSYDAAGRAVTVHDPLDRTVTMAYDGAGRATSVTRPDGSVLTWAYDAVGRTTAHADPSGTTTYAYDNAGRPTLVTDPAGRATAYTWDAAGQLTATTLPSGGTATYGYDNAGRRTSTTYSDTTPDVTWTYDAAGQVQQVSDGTSYTWTPTGLVASITRPTGTVMYGYDTAGRPTTIGYPDGKQVTYTWDAADQLVKVTDWTGGQYHHTWTVDGQVASVTYPNGVSTGWDYDTAGQNTAVTTTQPDGTALLALAYTFDDAGQVATSTSVRSPTGRSPPNPASTTSQLTFDPLGRLETVTGTGAGTFGWDTAGLVTGTADGRSLSYDTAGRLAAVAKPGTGTTTFGYDTNGNRTTATTTTGTGTTTQTLGWDLAGHLVTHTDATSATAYTYDATGLRTSATTTTGGTTTSEQYVWDTTRAVPTVLADAEHTYVYGLGDTPLAQVGTNGEVVYLHTDLVGSVRTATGPGAHVVCDADYDPYGQPQPVTTDPCTSVTRFGYAGQYTDPTGLQYLRNRYYDPATAQFVSVDPLAEVTGDPYGYAGGNPLQNTDPLGLDWEKRFWDTVRTVSNASAGFGDAMTMDGTKAIRQLFLIDDVVNYCSGAYTWGGHAGTAASLVIPGGSAARGATSSSRMGASAFARSTTRASSDAVANTTVRNAAKNEHSLVARARASRTINSEQGSIGRSPYTGRMTAHGEKRMAEAGFDDVDVALMRGSGRSYEQMDGAMAYVTSAGKGKYNYIVENLEHEIVTAHRGMTAEELAGLARNYGWSG
ncbi:MAG: DUF6531 domain-containing protein [Micrococcales bacterium]|nr:DUF6531 domain-containing protein [Micrococcales bacterium]